MGYKNDDPCIKKAYDDERLFVLMARDPQAPEVIIKWIAHSLGNQPDDKIREALECAIEMQKRGEEFRKRKEEDDKKAAEIKEREEFEAWKRRQRQGEALVNAGLAMRRPGPIGGISHDKVFINEVGTMNDEALKKIASNADVRFAERFAEWLDEERNEGGALWNDTKTWANTDAFKIAYRAFLKTLPSAR